MAEELERRLSPAERKLVEQRAQERIAERERSLEAERQRRSRITKAAVLRQDATATCASCFRQVASDGPRSFTILPRPLADHTLSGMIATQSLPGDHMVPHVKSLRKKLGMKGP